MPLAEDDDMVKTFPPDRADQPVRSAMAIAARWAGLELSKARSITRVGGA